MKPTRRSALATLGLTLVSGCAGILESDERDELVGPEDLVIEHDRLEREEAGTDEERVYVRGVVRNQGEREPGYVEIRATFLDAEAEEIDRIIERVEDVTEGDEWPFEIEFPNFGEAAAKVKDYELEILTSL